MYSERIKEIQKKISIGVTYTELCKSYPITKALYRKLGGSFVRPVNTNNDILSYIVDPNYNILNKNNISNIDHDAILGTLLGDANIYKITGIYDDTYTYSLAHTYAQIEYIKFLYELYKPYTNRLQLREPSDNDGFKDYWICIILKSDIFFKTYYDMFYSYDAGLNNKQKYVFTDKIAEGVNWKSLSFWVMDDGNKSGSGKGVFEISIGKKPYYEFNEVKRFTEIVSNNLNFKLKATEEKSCYTIKNDMHNSSEAISQLSKYLLPHFHYKLGVLPDDCYYNYRHAKWFKDWEKSKHNIQHPFLIDRTVTDYRESEDPIFKVKFENALKVRTIIRGFPFYDLSEEEKRYHWGNITRYEAKLVDKKISASPKANTFPSSFMNHRFYTKIDNKPSPYEAFYDRKNLELIIQKQVDSGDNIENSNIRNAIGYYRSQVAGQFNPCFAKYYINKYCAGASVFDPCAGWGGRLCGAASLNKSYYGIEPYTKTYESLKEMAVWIKGNTDCLSEICISNGVAEDDSFFSGLLFDMAITSPPYFNKERYCNEDTQSYIRYPHYEDWKIKFFKKMILNVFNRLKIGSYFILNIADVNDYSLVLDAILIAKEIGFLMEDVHKASTFKSVTNFSKMNETFLILKKD